MNAKISAVALGISLIALLIASWGSISAVIQSPEKQAATQGELTKSTEIIRVQMDDLERRNAELRAALTTAERRLKVVEVAHAATEGQLEQVDDQMVEIFRAKSPAEKVAMIAAAHRTAHMLAASGIRYQHPEWSEARIQQEAVSRVSSATG